MQGSDAVFIDLGEIVQGKGWGHGVGVMSLWLVKEGRNCNMEVGSVRTSKSSCRVGWGRDIFYNLLNLMSRFLDAGCFESDTDRQLKVSV